MKWKTAALGVLVAGMAACSDNSDTMKVTGAPQMAQTPTTLISNVTGTLTGGTFTGTAQITNFALQNGQLVVSGVLNGVATVGGITTQIVNQAFTTAASLTSSGAGRCDILNLDVGAIHLDLLGLNVDLARVLLDVTAVAGSGKLLGNLLCAVVHLLDNPLANIAGVLNLLSMINNLLG